MNKEEVKKAIKALICSQIGKCYFPRRNCRTCLEQNRRIIKNYIKELEQKEAMLNKVKALANEIAIENAEKYNSKNQKEVDFSEWNLALGILDIINIKGDEKNNGQNGV